MIKNRISISVLSILICCSVETFAQEYLKDIVPLTPNSSSLGKYGEHPVRLNTGMVDISVPLHTINAGEISVPVNLSYHASGIRINDLASSVGLGWSLNAGGSIIRSVRGIEDEKGHPGQLLAEDIDMTANNVHVRRDFEYLNLAASLQREDLLYDTYFLNANGISAKFWIESDGTIKIEDGSPLIITKVDGSLFEVIDQNGFLYRFGTSLANEEFIERTDNQNAVAGIGNNVETAWKLTEIISPDRSETVSFKYYLDQYIKPIDLTGDRAKVYPNGLTQINLSKSNPYMIDELLIKEINFKGGKLVFNSILDRQDIISSRRLSDLEVRNDVGVIKKISLDNNQYYNRVGGYQTRVASVLNRTSVSVQDSKSLRLDGVRLLDKNNLEIGKYTFDYNQTSLPIRNSLAQDYWGYYNGQTSNQGLIHDQTLSTPIYSGVGGIPIEIGNADREPDATLMQAGILEKITYPTGGYSVFEFEGHAWESVERVANTTLHTESVTAIGYPDRPCAIASNTSCDPDTDIFDQITFTPTSDSPYIFTTLNLNMMELEGYLDSGCGSGKITFQQQGATPSVYLHSGTPPVLGRYEAINVTLNSGATYTLTAEECGYGTPSPLYDSPRASASISWTEITYSNESVIKYGSGLRIKTIKSFNEDNSFQLGKKYEYNSNGTGRIITHPLYYQSGSIANMVDGTMVKYVSSSSMVEFGSNGGSPVEYSYIIERSIDSLANDNGYRKLTYEPMVTNHLYQNMHYDVKRFLYGYKINFPVGPPLIIDYSPATKVADYTHFVNEINALTSTFTASYVSEGELTINHQGEVFYFNYWDEFLEKVNELFAGIYEIEEIISFEPFTGLVPGDLPSFPIFVHDYWAAGKLKTEEVFERHNGDQYRKIKQVENQYKNYNTGRVKGLGLYSRRELAPSTNVNGEEFQGVYATYEDYVTTGLRLLDNQKMTLYDENSSITTSSQYYYEHPDFLLTKVETTNSKNEQVKQLFYYPDNAGSISGYPSGQLGIISSLNKGGTYPRVGQKIQEETFVNNNLIKTVRSEFKNKGGGRILLSKILTANGSADLDTEVEYTKHDDFGNPLQITNKAGIVTSYIWGYDHAYPVAQIINADYENAKTILGGDVTLTVLQNQSGQTLLSTLAVLRTLPNSQVTTYTYKLGYGIESITDYNDRKTEYVYDDLGRLRAVKDHDGNVLQKNEYNYGD